MAAYATRAEMYALALNSGAFSGIATADQDSALEAASRFADSYITTRFQLPLTVWGDDLKEAVSNIATYRVMAVRGFSPEQGDAEQLRQRFDDAKKWLKDVSLGQATPYGITDSAGRGTQAADELTSQGPIVAQYRAETTSADTLFHGSTVTPGGVGPPKPRGW